MNIQKVIIISSIVSTNVVVWHEIFGIDLLIILGIIVACLVAFFRER